MPDKVAGEVSVGTNGRGEVILVNPDADHLPRDPSGVAHVVFSVDQARAFGELILLKAEDAATERGLHFKRRKNAGWRCFHCRAYFTTIRDAAEHFGSNEGEEAGCRLNRGEGELLARFREVSAECTQLRAQLEQAEYDSGASVRAQLGRQFKCAETVDDAFNVYDSMEGRALAAEERVRTLEAANEAVAAQAKRS